MGAHCEIPIKVNAWVDEGIAPLVLALNDLENVWTLDSCEDDQSGLGWGAYVILAYERGGPEAVRFVDTLRNLGDSAPPYRLRVRWESGSGEDKPFLVLSCPPDQVRELAQAISADPSLR